MSYLGDHDHEEVVLLDVVLGQRAFILEHLAGVDELLLRDCEAVCALDLSLDFQHLEKIRPICQPFLSPQQEPDAASAWSLSHTKPRDAPCP